MSIQLSNLTVKADGKTVREYIATPQGSIEIYEPTLETVNQILAIQQESGFDFTQEIIEFDEKVLLNQIFPLLTNIETDNLSESELEEIIANPSIHLLITQNIVAQIISESNKLYAERMKAELASADSVLAQSDLISSIPSIITEHAKRNPEVAENLKKIEEAQSQVEQMITEEESQLNTEAKDDTQA